MPSSGEGDDIPASRTRHEEALHDILHYLTLSFRAKVEYIREHICPWIHTFYALIVLFGLDRLYNVRLRTCLWRVLKTCYVSGVYSTSCLCGILYFYPSATSPMAAIFGWAAIIINSEGIMNAVLVSTCLHTYLDADEEFDLLTGSLSDSTRRNFGMVLASPISSMLWSIFSMFAFVASYPAAAKALELTASKVPIHGVEGAKHSSMLGSEDNSISSQTYHHTTGSTIAIICLVLAAILRFFFTMHTIHVLEHESRAAKEQSNGRIIGMNNIGHPTQTRLQEDSASQTTAQNDLNNPDVPVGSNCNAAPSIDQSRISIDAATGPQAGASDDIGSGTGDSGNGANDEDVTAELSASIHGSEILDVSAQFPMSL